MNTNNIINLLPQQIRENVRAALQQALNTVDPTAIKTKADAQKVLQNLQSNGLNTDVLTRLNKYLDTPFAAPILGALGIQKQDFRNGLQSLTQPDAPSALTNSSLLQGIDQLK